MNKTGGMWLTSMVAGVALFAVGMAAGSTNERNRHDVWSQAHFPCQEDEVLMYIEHVSNDRVGCVHIEEVK